jgi:hypothetical protein
MASRPDAGGAMPFGETPTASPDLTSRVRFDACPTWLELAIRHLSDAQAAQAARVAAWKGTDEDSKAGALEWEFEASMQSIMAASIAIEAFCSAIQAKAHLPQAIVDECREKRLPRHAEISDILAIAFSLTDAEMDKLRRNLGEIFRFRDLAIDTSSKSDAPILHPEIRVGGEWRFAYFRCENALLIVRATFHVLRELFVIGTPQDAEVQTYVDVLRPRLEQLQDSNTLKAHATVTGA